MKAPTAKSTYSAKDWDSLEFHDCHVHGIRWERSTYSFLLQLDFIIEWVETGNSYEFWLSPAELRFDYASNVNVSLPWTNDFGECQIDSFHRQQTNPSPTGVDLFTWKLEFSSPAGSIELTSSDFRLDVLESPVLRNVQHLR